MYSNLWISLGAVALTLNFYVITNEAPNLNVLGFVFSSTLFTYNFQRLLKIYFKINVSGQRIEWILTHQILVHSLTFLSLLSTLYFAVLFFESVWELFLVSGVISFFYVWKIPLLNGKNLRDLPGIKIYLIALVWVIICVLMPTILSENSKINETTFLISLALFIALVSITIPFDIRDIDLDETSKKTIPQLIGIKSSVYLSIGLLVLSQVLLQLLIPFNAGIWIFTLLGIFILYQAKNRQPELYFSGGVDGLLMVQIGLLYLFFSVP